VSEIAPGWYKDPAEPTTQRYWDGEVWIGDSLPADATPPPGPPAGSVSVPKRASSENKVAGRKVADAASSGSGSNAGTPSTGTGEPTQGETPGANVPPAAPPGWPALPGWPPQGDAGAPSTNGEPPADQPGGQQPPGWPPTTWPPQNPPEWQSPPPGGQQGWQAPPPSGQQGWQAPPPTGQQGAPPGWPPGAWPPGTRPGSWPTGRRSRGDLSQGWPGYPYMMLPAPRPHGMALAPLGRRFWARLIDIGIVAVLSAVLTSYLAYQWWQETSGYWRQMWQAAEATSQGAKVSSVAPTMSSRGTWLSLAIILLIMGIWLAYEVPNIASSGQTLGKRLMRIKVVGLDATTPIGIRRAMRRWVPLGIPMIVWTCGPLGILVGGFLQLIDCVSPAINRPLQLARHDRSAFTVVVQVGTGPPTDGTASDQMANSGAGHGGQNDGRRHGPHGGSS
jgi:uncharacterized RDD family membrane protein YckC